MCAILANTTEYRAHECNVACETVYEAKGAGYEIDGIVYKQCPWKSITVRTMQLYNEIEQMTSLNAMPCGGGFFDQSAMYHAALSAVNRGKNIANKIASERSGGTT